MTSALIFAGISGWFSILWLSIYAHRSIAHRALTLHPALAHGVRFWLWLTLGLQLRRWVAVHRRHHALTDREGDPHSPLRLGLWRVLLFGYFYYRRESNDPATLERYGQGCPDDWIERALYARFEWLGLALFCAGAVAWFGPGPGLVALAVQLAWAPLWAGGVVNGIGHSFGYRSFRTADASRNVLPIGLLVAGEELHHNHHACPRSARFSVRRWELDVGWLVVRGLEGLGLCRDLFVLDRRAEPYQDLKRGGAQI
jgi:stearoyl-CoA desaturase (delta-9 desaturase)